MKVKVYPAVYPNKITIEFDAIVEAYKHEFEVKVEGVYERDEYINDQEELFRKDILIIQEEGLKRYATDEDFKHITTKVIQSASEFLPIKINVKPTYATEPSKEVRKLAKKFSKVLASWLSFEQMQTVIESNAENNDSSCASHDFCDANMAMDEAFVKVMKRSFVFFVEDDPASEKANEYDTDLINQAWSLAKANKFYGYTMRPINF